MTSSRGRFPDGTIVGGNPDFLVNVSKGLKMFAPKSKKPEQSMAPIAVSTCPSMEAPLRTEVERPSVSVGENHNVIARGTVIEGNIIAEGDLIIEGTVRGDVTTKTTLIAGPTCIIEGNILADHAEVAGQVKGTVQALGLLVIKSSSMIDGDVLTKNLNVESGSTFNGRFTVGSVTSTNGAAKKSENGVTKAESSILGGDIRRPVMAVPTVTAKI